MKNIIYLATLTFLFLSVSPLPAEELNYNLVGLKAEVEKRIDNDVLIVTMSNTAETNTARSSAEIVNQNMIWAMQQLNSKPAIKAQTMNYQTHPRYKNKAIVGWSATQQLRLESTDIEKLSSLVGVLQAKLNVSSMRFEASAVNRKAAVNELITQALEKFAQKAQLITKTLGAGDYRIVKLSIGENNPSAPYRQSYKMEAMNLSKASAPQVKAGESKVSVRVDGTVQLIF